MLLRSFPRMVLTLIAAMICSWSVAVHAAEMPATVEKAAAVWNGLTWPVPKDVKDPQRGMAGLVYEAAGEAQAAFAFQQKALIAAKWKEEAGAYLSKESCSGVYRKDGYALSLTSYVAQPGRVNVMLTAHGNVDVSKLPVPTGAKSTYPGPVSAMYITDAAPDKTADAVTAVLAKQGWQPYGAVGDTRWFRQNAVRLTAFIGAAPAQGNKTSITYSTELMSAELPAPPVTINLQYADSTKTVSFDSADSIADVLKFYQTTLKKLGWEATTENLIKVDFRQTMIFRNKAKDMLTLELHEFEGKTRCLLKHQSAAEVEEQYQREKAAATKAANAKPTPAGMGLQVKVPVKAKDVEVSESSIEYTLGSNDVKPAVQELAAALKKAGWKLDKDTENSGVGAMMLSKGDANIVVTYFGLPGLPGSVNIVASGVKLERAAEK